MTRRDLFARLWRAIRHRHDWQRVGYGGAGWYLYACADCGAREIR